MLTMTLALLIGGAAPQLDRNNDPERCKFDLDQGAMVLVRGFADKVAPGDRIEIKPAWTPMPSWFDDVPMRCLKKWSVSDPKVATLSKDHRQLVVSTAARAGQKFTLSAVYNGKVISREWTVMTPRVSPIVGIWHQTEKDCDGALPLRELKFDRDGHFTATWRPFETYVDISGKWSVDGNTLSLTDISGNYIPSDMVKSGKFDIADGELRFASPMFGSPQNARRCDAAFRK